MERYSLFDVEQAKPVVAPGKTPEAQSREDLRFPAEHAGASLAEIAQRDLAAALQLLCERAQYITAASGAAIALRDQERMVCCASAGPSAPELGSELAVNSGLSGESVRTRQILRCDNAESDSRVNRESCRALGIASVVVLPVVANDEVIGVFELFSSRPYAFEERDIVALQRLAEMIQTALEQADAVKRCANEIATSAEPSSINLPENVPIAAPESIKEAHGESQQSSAPVQDRAKEEASLAAALVGTVQERAPAEAPAPEAASPLITGVVEEKPPQPIAAAPAIPEKAEEAAPAATPEYPAALPEPTAAPILPDGVALHFKIGKCETCGFPVSEGRRICIDCEKKTRHELAQPELTEIISEDEVPGWFAQHRVAVMLVLLLIIAAVAAFYYLR